MVIPAEITARHGVSQEEVFRRGAEAEGVRDAVWEFASTANEQLNVARDTFRAGGDGKVPRGAMPVFLAGVRRLI
jgi:NADH dehydrogenase [ubiquinone] 1 alpha subcomplex assembly factor 6